MSSKLLIVSIILNSLLFICFVKSDENVVKTTSGSVKGLTFQVLNKSIDQFLSIPFAEPPVGSLRFAKPKPISKPIEGIIDATKPKYSCIQPNQPKLQKITGKLNLSEDCLTLNIWSAKRQNNNLTSLKPVMFWIHGGALAVGTSLMSGYNGSVLATHEIVIVSINYRVGHFGFLYGGDESAPGNVGFYDQLLALKWVRENIHLFGGDKNQITIFGQSAGSWSVAAQLLSPLSKGLFKRAIMESGAHMYNKDRPILSKEEGLLMAKQLAKQVNCTDEKQWLQCLKKVDAKHLVPSEMVFVYPVDGTEFLPFSAQKAFNEKKFNKDLDLMAGVTKDEGTGLAPFIMPEIVKKNLTKDDFTKFITITNQTFHGLHLKNITEFYLKNIKLNDSEAIKSAINDFYGDIIAKCPTFRFAKRYSEQSKHETNIFFYELTYSMKAVPGMGVQHGAEVAFVFGLSLLNPKTNSKENIEFSKYIMKLWTNFAKYGKPDNDWPKLIISNTKTHSSANYIKDLNPKNANKYYKNLFEETCDGFWKHFY